jgi:hypothetical protein
MQIVKSGPEPLPRGNRDEERDLISRWVNAWRSARPELETIRRHEAAAMPVREAIRQIFDGMDSVLAAPARLTSGLVEQQMWFSRVRAGVANGKPTDPRTNE